MLTSVLNFYYALFNRALRYLASRVTALTCINSFQKRARVKFVLKVGSTGPTRQRSQTGLISQIGTRGSFCDSKISPLPIEPQISDLKPIAPS